MIRFIIFIFTTLAIAYLAYTQAPTMPQFSSQEEKLENLNHPSLINNPTSIAHPLILPKPDIKSTHSSSLAFLSKDEYRADFLVAYFGGSREGARDVEIYGNIISLDSKNQKIASSDAFSILSRSKLSLDSGEMIKKLGNPLLVRQANSLHLFVTATSFGGWANSKLYHYEITWDKENLKLKFKGRLHTSPFINLSTLVRNTGLNMQDGFYLLPAYHELAKKYPILIFLDDHKISHIMRPTLKNTLLQPAITPTSIHSYLLAYRSYGRDHTLFMQLCNNNKCQNLTPSNLENDDNSLNLITQKNQIYLIHNAKGTNSNRALLKLSKLQNISDKIDFQEIGTLASTTTPNGEVSYPSSLVFDEFIITSYTIDRKNIGIMVFKPENTNLKAQP